MRKSLSSNTNVSKTFIYMLPLLNISQKLVKEYCIDAFCGEATMPELNNHIFLLFEFHADPIDEKLQREFSSSPDFYNRYHVDKNYVMFIFKVGEKWEKDYLQFKDSKYSKLSEEAKKTIKAYHHLDVRSKTHGILYKTEGRRQWLEQYLSTHDDGTSLGQVTVPADNEYDDALDLNQEIFDPLRFQTDFNLNLTLTGEKI